MSDGAELTLGDSVLWHVLQFFDAFDRAADGTLILDEVDEQIDVLALGAQTIDQARSNPGEWAELVPAPTSAYEHLWPAEQILLFLLANYGALHAAVRQGMQVPLMSAESLAHEVLDQEWISQEASPPLVNRFLAHPASQVSER